jgi:GNAT superfamily N-acetyltransferase
MRRRELAGFLQRTEAVELGSYLDAAAALAKRTGASRTRIAGVTCLASTMIDEPVLNRAFGVGTVVAATPALLERIERHYASAGKPSRIAIATGCVPLATFRALERRGYRPMKEHEQLIYVYERRAPPTMPNVDGLTIERVGQELATVYSRTGFESFSDRGPRFVAIVESIVRSRPHGLRAFLGRIDGEPAATGMLFDARPVGGLGNGSVRPKFRGRGLQTAMIAHRIRDGWARGYRIFFGQTVNPVSAHNMEDLGWRKLYTEQHWERAG